MNIYFLSINFFTEGKMVTPEWLTNFSSNFWSTLLAGILLGLLIDAVITRRQALQEKTLKYLEQNISKSEKAEIYITKLHLDILNISLEILKNEETVEKKGSIHFISLRTDYWEILEKGGELNNVFSPYLVYILSSFFSTAKEINELDNRISLARINSIGSNDEVYLNELILEKINELKESKDSTIKDLEEYQELNKNFLNALKDKKSEVGKSNNLIDRLKEIPTKKKTFYFVLITALIIILLSQLIWHWIY
jgi:hypothetical protein